MRVPVGEKIPAKGVNPVARRAEKAMLVAVVLVVDRAGVRRHVRGLEGGVVIEHGRVIAAVIILVGLDVKRIGEHPAAVAEHDVENVAGRAAAAPGLKLRLQMRGQSETGKQQREEEKEKSA